MAPSKKSTPATAVAPTATAVHDTLKVSGGKKAPAHVVSTPVKTVKQVSSEVPVVLSHTVPAPVVPVVPVVPSVPADASTAVPVAPVEGSVVAPQDNVLTTIVEKVNVLVSNFKEVQLLLKLLSKDYEKQQKIIEKAQKKRQNAKNSPSGFAKPNKISDELCDFIGVPHGTEKSRTDITRFINAYVKEHNLNKPENKRFILPDDKLKKILNVSDKEEINYFILQKLISHHFPPSASKLAAAAALKA